MSDHYFAADPRVDLRPRSVAFSLDGRDWTLQSGSGVFSADRLDPGTRVLLRAVPRAGAGTLLDLGCGYGALACVLAVRAPRAQVWAVDVNQRALSLTRQNAQALGVADRVVVAAADEVPDAMTFDEIWSNPPIRIGKPALHDLLTRWLGRLSSGGQAWLVVARNL